VCLKRDVKNQRRKIDSREKKTKVNAKGASDKDKIYYQIQREKKLKAEGTSTSDPNLQTKLLQSKKACHWQELPVE